MIQTTSPVNDLHMLPQPRLAPSSSRTTRVIEELQENLESIQKELESTKAQLEIVKENKEQSEKENEEYIESNKQLRADIQEIMQILESKQQLLDDAKKSYVSTENKVKQLKDEAMAARRELDELKRREHTIEKERRTIELQMEKQREQQRVLEDSVAQTKADFEKELEAFKIELDTVQEQIDYVKSKDVEGQVKLLLEQKTEERKALFEEFQKIQKELENNNQAFIAQAKQQLIDLMNEIKTNASTLLNE
ncbi:MAG: hypothetical protein EXX96DRAFT_593700 [Benjaminiella poitrasii]|nr:MAG: hypothetical protein EXX96DRAFT_593700 [Benjaminiella poitrasii]